MQPWEIELAAFSRALKQRPAAPRLGADTGGTFTDFVLWEGDRARSWKVPSLPDDPGAPIRDVLAAGRLGDGDPLFVGTTVGTNALLEARGARVALLTTAGFEDLLEIGRQNRPDPYTLAPPPTSRGVALELRFGLTERIGPGGAIETPLDPAALGPLLARIAGAQAEAIAVVLLHSWINDTHEREAGAVLRRAFPEIPVLLSSEVLPEIREFERLAATVASAVVAPLMRRFLDGLAAGERPVGVSLSSGGMTPQALARLNPVRTLLSGPAAGAVAARSLARALGLGPLVTLDMGGTSTDCAWIDPAAADLPLTTRARLGDWPVAVPAADIVTIGAGGGSIARADAAGALTVGPESAGAEPGPAAAGRGREATLTDAALVLGLIPETAPLPPGVRFDRALARAALARLADRLGSGTTPEAAAAAVVAGATAHMERALRAASAARGEDPRGASLLAYGGAGGLFAAELARRLEIDRVVIPPSPGAFAAWGALVAPRRVDWGRSVEIPAAQLDGAPPAAPFWEFLGPFVPAEPDEPGYACFFGARYPGQAHELLVPAGAGWEAAFHDEHERRAGHADRATRPLVTTLRVVARSLPQQVPFPEPMEPASSRGAAIGGVTRLILSPGGASVAAPVVDRREVGRFPLPGPAVIVERGATVIVPLGWVAAPHARAGELLVLTRGD